MPDMGYQEHFLAKYQAKLGHEVHVVTSNRAYPVHEGYAAFSTAFPQRVLAVGVSSQDGYQVHRLAAYGEKHLQLFMRGILATLRSIDPDLVVMHSITRYETLRVAAWKKLTGQRLRLVADDHSLYVVLEFDWKRRVYRGIVRFLLHQCGLLDTFHAVVPVTEETRRLLHEHYAIPLERMVVLPISADTSQFQFSQAGRDRVREQLGIPTDFVVLGYYGKLSSERGVADAYEISRELFARHPRFGLLFVGSGLDGEFARQLMARVEQDGFGRRVFWHGQVSHQELPAFYSAADIATWPKFASMGCLEAASCGLPIVISDLAVSRERTAAGNGFIWESNEVAQRAVERLICEPALRREMGEKGKTFVREHFDWAAVAQKFLFQN